MAGFFLLDSFYGSMTLRVGKILIANFVRLPAGRQVGFNLSRKIVSMKSFQPYYLIFMRSE